MDVARFGVGDVEGEVWGVGVLLQDQVFVKLYDIAHQIFLELLHICLLFFAREEFLPGFEEIFYRNDRIVQIC